ncbi:MAG: RNA-binding protein [Cenarchaeum symbiont of Oopsacas minuta]|nr:RNA-binding protein [Cenarchaeum symbiont of Oopsacas minuta]
MSKNVFPGDKVSSIEEYEVGTNTFDDKGTIRAAVIGTTNMDSSSHVVDIKRASSHQVAQPDDIIIGTVTAVLSSIIPVSIEYVNGKKVTNGVECVCSTRNRRERIVALVGDLVKLKIINQINGTIHASVSDPELGVLHTKCRVCGSRVVTINNGVKCVECGWKDDRKLSSDYGNINTIISLNAT